MTVKTDKSATIKDHRRHDSDTGSPEVQIAILTERILKLGQHLRDNKHDNATRRGLLQMVSRRRKLLRFLGENDTEKHGQLIAKLGIRA